MKRLILGVLLGLMAGSTVHGAEQMAVLDELSMETVGRTQFEIPKAYGDLVNVAIDSNIHYLYFQDGKGKIRVVLLGPRGAAPRARSPIQLLNSDVYVLERD